MDDALARLYGAGTGRGGGPAPAALPQPPGGLYCSRCSAVLSEAEALRVEERRMREEEIVARVVRKLMEMAPTCWRGSWWTRGTWGRWPR